MKNPLHIFTVFQLCLPPVSIVSTVQSTLLLRSVTLSNMLALFINKNLPVCRWSNLHFTITTELNNLPGPASQSSLNWVLGKNMGSKYGWHDIDIT